MDELKRCLHCGGEAEYRSRMHYGGEVWVECKSCGMRTKFYRVPGPGKSEELAKAAWERETECWGAIKDKHLIDIPKGKEGEPGIGKSEELAKAAWERKRKCWGVIEDKHLIDIPKGEEGEPGIEEQRKE